MTVKAVSNFVFCCGVFLAVHSVLKLSFQSLPLAVLSPPPDFFPPFFTFVAAMRPQLCRRNLLIVLLLSSRVTPPYMHLFEEFFSRECFAILTMNHGGGCNNARVMHPRQSQNLRFLLLQLMLPRLINHVGPSWSLALISPVHDPFPSGPRCHLVRILSQLLT